MTKPSSGEDARLTSHRTFIRDKVHRSGSEEADERLLNEDYPMMELPAEVYKDAWNGKKEPVVRKAKRSDEAATPKETVNCEVRDHVNEPGAGPDYKNAKVYEVGLNGQTQMSEQAVKQLAAREAAKRSAAEVPKSADKGQGAEGSAEESQGGSRVMDDAVKGVLPVLVLFNSAMSWLKENHEQ